jgi:type IV fimbrial biogenesis protein FimT
MQTTWGESESVSSRMSCVRDRRVVDGDSLDQKTAVLPEQRRIEVAKATTRRFVRGFTLTELMVTLTVMVILVAIAIPSFNRLILSNRLTTTANDMVGAINSARMEAVKRNAATQFCGSTTVINTTDTLGTACGTQTGAVLLLLNGTSPATTATVLAPLSGLAGSIQLSSAGANALRFNGSGLAQIPGTSTLFAKTVADICTASMSNNNHVTIKMTAGSILQTSTASGTCP